jgi:hypothetical protein
MRRLGSMLLGFLMVLALFAVSWGASEQATAMRGKNALAAFTPLEAFLSGNFVADEVEPVYIFGKVGEFAKARSCPTTWLIEEGEKKRVAAWDRQSGPIEYSLYLEEDCPGKVAYYVFVDRSEANLSQWMSWRQQFHGKSKTEPQYGTAKSGLEQAAQNGFLVGAELRFVEINGDLSLKKPEELLIGELKWQPIYDLKQGKAVTK